MVMILIYKDYNLRLAQAAASECNEMCWRNKADICHYKTMDLNGSGKAA